MTKQSLEKIINVINENIDQIEKLSKTCEKRNPTLAASLDWIGIQMKYILMLYEHELSKEK